MTMFPSLRRRLERQGAAEARFAGMDNRLGDWVVHGPAAPHAIVAQVENQIAGYFGSAARAGLGWGAVVGLAVGGLGAAVIVVAFWVAS